MHFHTVPVSIEKKSVKDLILARALFAIFLCMGCFIYSASENLSFYSQPFVSLYNLSAVILFASIGYIILHYNLTSFTWFVYFQLILDTFFISAVVFITGSSESIFTFLYLLVIIYSSMLVLLKGSLIIATLVAAEYTALLLLEHYGILVPFGQSQGLSGTVEVSQVIYKGIVVAGAGYAIAGLSGLLALQTRRARQELKITRQHLTRVEKMTAMDEMLSGVAHEIKNPLASLSGSIQLLKDECDPGSSEEKLMQIILRETDRLTQIANDIRLFSKPGKSGAVVLRMEKVLRETIELFANDPKWQDRIEIFVKFEKNIFVFMDPVHCKQILWNLLTNAAQAITGTGKIYIHLYSPKQNRVYLVIKDTGKGISKKEALSVFDPFYTTKQEGSGLGLSIVHKIVDTYDGMIDFESEPGKGTVFTLIFNYAPPPVQ